MPRADILLPRLVARSLLAGPQCLDSSSITDSLSVDVFRIFCIPARDLLQNLSRIQWHNPARTESNSRVGPTDSRVGQTVRAIVCWRLFTVFGSGHLTHIAQCDSQVTNWVPLLLKCIIIKPMQLMRHNLVLPSFW